MLRHPMRLFDGFLGELVAKAVLVDRDEAEASWSEGIAEHRIDPCADAGGRPVTSHSTRSPGSASFKSLMNSSRRSRLSTGESQKRSPSS